jgi:hypothetical protein
MSGDILPLSQYAFMAWCSVKEKMKLQLVIEYEFGTFIGKYLKS